MSDYTPTTEDIRVDWVTGRMNGGGVPYEEAEAEFDRWLAQHERPAASLGAWIDCQHECGHECNGGGES